ncbi:MAG: ATPase, T2SS/T4P/T4SS family [Deltaproteobacteria bacterium]|nr:ATPase, T2SS/T4P/T4SS family [Deltaproteobacteria bacterium]
MATTTTTTQRPLLSLLGRAWERGASHLLIDLSATKRSPPRMRIDGVLHDLEPLADPEPVWLAVCGAVDLDVTERRLPQSGLLLVRVNDDDVSATVECVPVVDGVFISLALHSADPYRAKRIDQLGMTVAETTALRSTLVPGLSGTPAPGAGGLVVFSGPTWSGKNTTAYACLLEIDRTRRAVATVEMVPRARLPDVHQSVTDDDIGRTAAALLRSLRRTSVDVVYVRELMDAETADVAIGLALRKGVTVLTTLHTNDAPSTLTRMMNMGIEPWLIAATVPLVQAQRLLRRLCAACKQPAHPLPAALRHAGVADDDAARFFGPVGCGLCNQTGFAGRVLAVEQLVVDEALAELLVHGASTKELRACARDHGMRSLRESALAALSAGETTLEEVLSSTASG